MASEAPELLQTFKGQIESLTDDLLRPYIARLADARISRFRKEFNDTVWATLSLYPFEVILVDSPLVQRLRRIRQLGVAHWVYPAATHSRFEHTLGVVHQVQR